MDSELQENIGLTLRAFESLAERWRHDRVEALAALRREVARLLKKEMAGTKAGKVIACPGRG